MQVLRWRRLVVAALLLHALPALAQRNSALMVTTAPVIDTARSVVLASPRTLGSSSSPISLTFPILPAGAATAHYGFFCRQELKWDKKLPTQLRFRVGSYEACDRLEGKRRD